MIRTILSFTNLVFLLGTLLSIVLIISATSWYMVWTGLECNMFSFIPLMMYNKIQQEKEAAMKYLFAQGIPSGLLLMTIFNNNENMVNSSSFLILLLAMKLGMAPMHFWFPSVMNASSWFNCWMLSTVQKMAPFILLSQSMSFSPFILYFIIFCSSIVSSIGGINQTMLRPLLAYSSIGHMSWAVAVSFVEKDIAIIYFLSYIFIVSSSILLFSYLNMKFNNQISLMSSSYSMNWAIFFSLGSISGLPPMFGFFPKILVLMKLSENSMVFLGSILIISSMMNMYFYLKVMFSSVMVMPSSFFFPINKKLFYFLYFAIIIMLSSFSFSLLTLLFFL